LLAVGRCPLPCSKNISSVSPQQELRIGTFLLRAESTFKAASCSVCGLARPWRAELSAAARGGKEAPAFSCWESQLGGHQGGHGASQTGIRTRSSNTVVGQTSRGRVPRASSGCVALRVSALPWHELCACDLPAAAEVTFFFLIHAVLIPLSPCAGWR